MGRLHVDLFLQVHFLINGVTVTNRFVRSKETFALMASGAVSNPKVHIIDANMFAIKAARHETGRPNIAYHGNRLGYGQIPFASLHCKGHSITQGNMSHSHQNVFLGSQPKGVVLCCIDDIFNAVYTDSRQVTAKPLQPKFHFLRLRPHPRRV